MTQEEKSLLLKDLCARLPYGIFVKDEFDDKNIYTIDYHPHLKTCKPYLRSLSDMTEKEIRNYKCLNDALDENYEVHIDNAYNAFDWLNACYLDYRGLIEKGLALKAPKDMYTKTE